jgi:hypothetical protein
MHKLPFLVTFAFSLSPCAALAELVREAEKARAANDHDIDAQAAKAEALSPGVEHELPVAIESAKRDDRTVL